LHPALFEIPVPPIVVPLGLVLAIGAVMCALAAWSYLHRDARGRSRALAALAALAALGVAFASWRLWGYGYELGPIPVTSYGALLCAALVAGWWMTLALAERGGMQREHAGSLYVVAALCGLLGARLAYLWDNASQFRSLAEAVALRQGGFTAYGGFVGGTLGAWWYARRRRLSLRRFADAATPALAVGLCLARMGCYLFGCDFGRPLHGGGPKWLAALGSFPRWLDGPLAHLGSPAWRQQVEQGLLPPTASASLPVHPTQLYEAITGVALAALALALLPRRRAEGQVFLALVVAYGAARFFLEALRGDLERGSFGPVAPVWLAVPLAGLLFAGAWLGGPGGGGRVLRWSPVAVIAAAAAALVVLAWRSGYPAAPLSSAQWIALATALAAVIAARRWSPLAPRAAVGEGARA
jgi:phosphatidylglycerol:prolipoprotein diacylglycerol transferase